MKTRYLLLFFAIGWLFGEYLKTTEYNVAKPCQWPSHYIK